MYIEIDDGEREFALDRAGQSPVAGTSTQASSDR
jgi:hypothetical protein